MKSKISPKSLLKKDNGYILKMLKEVLTLILLLIKILEVIYQHFK